MSLIIIRKTDGVPERVAVGGEVYEAISPSMNLHKVIGGQVASVAGCEPCHAATLVEVGGGVFVKVQQAPPPSPKKKKAKLVEVEITTESEPASKPEDDNSELSSALACLDQSVKKLTEDVASGDYDHYLEAMLSAEQGGNTRRSAVRVLKERISEIGG
jgi:hypothetical protein